MKTKEEINNLAIELIKELESHLINKTYAPPLSFLYKLLYKAPFISTTIINCSSYASYNILLRPLLEMSILTAYIAFSDISKAKEQLGIISSYQRFDSIKFKLINSYNKEYFLKHVQKDRIDPELLSSTDSAIIEINNNNLDSVQFKTKNDRERFITILEVFQKNKKLEHNEVMNLFRLEAKKTIDIREAWTEVYDTVFNYQQLMPERKLCLYNSSCGSWGKDYQAFFIRQQTNRLNSSIHALSCLFLDCIEPDNSSSSMTDILSLKKDSEFKIDELCWLLELLNISLRYINNNAFTYCGG